jgi:fluoride exporter
MLQHRLEYKMGYLLVGIGGGFGSITRFALGKLISERSKTVFPRGTFVINITGALLLGILVTFQNYNNVYLLLGDGFLGAFTTFSTFMYEGFHLFQEKEKSDAFKYVIGSLALGIIGFIIGAKIGNSIKLI